MNASAFNDKVRVDSVDGTVAARSEIERCTSLSPIGCKAEGNSRHELEGVRGSASLPCGALFTTTPLRRCDTLAECSVMLMSLDRGKERRLPATI